MSHEGHGKLHVAILGTGNIGTDLLIKITKSKLLYCSYFIGRDPNSAGITLANKMGIKTSTKSIDAIADNPSYCNLVFDCTSAIDHVKHWKILEKLGLNVIDMTPSMVGKKTIPVLENKVIISKNVNMISCGGQVSIPIAYAINKINKSSYIEVVSSISSKSAGPGTRINIDEYVENTEQGIREFTGCPHVKAILIINPAEPEIDMQTTISLKMDEPDMKRITNDVSVMEKKINEYVPGYHIVVPPVYETNRVIVSVRVRGRGDFLPEYAGNLDIINAAAVATAEKIALCSR
jgi:acetaldehyde dehydrogenase